MAKLPSPNNNRGRKEKKTYLIPRFSFLKFSYLSNIFHNTFLACIFYFKPDYVYSYFFDRKSEAIEFELLKICAFYQGLPIFLALLGLRPSITQKTRNYFLPLAFNDLLMFLAIYTLKSNSYLAMSISGYSFLTNVFAFFVAKLKRSPVFSI